MAVGVWPYGLWNLAVWPLDSRRVALPHLRTLGWGSGVTRVEWSAIYPVPAPHLFPNSSGAPRALTPAGVEIAFLAGFVVLLLHW